MTQHTEGRTGAGTADLPGFDAELQALDEMEDFRQLMERLEMKSSARNQFHGTVLAIASGPVNAEVTLDIGGGNRLVAMITQGSVERLGLSPGNAAYALVKATSILLTDADDSLRLSTRNRLCGEVVWCREGAVNGEVTLDLGGDKTLTSILTNESIGHLELQEGMRACAVFKASSVILATR